MLGYEENICYNLGQVHRCGWVKLVTVTDETEKIYSFLNSSNKTLYILRLKKLLFVLLT